MKNFLTFLSFVFLGAPLFAQNHPDAKRDFQWPLGYDNNLDSQTYFRTMLMDFAQDSVIVSNVQGRARMNIGIGGVCDTAGKLLLATNGCMMLDSVLGELPVNTFIGRTPDPNYWGAICGTGTVGFGWPNMVTILPDPKDGSFSVFSHMVRNGNLSIQAIYFFRTKIRPDQSYHVDINDELIIEMPYDIEEGFAPGHLSSVRHGNGRDWWIVFPQVNTGNFYKYLFATDSISGPFIQKIGYVLTSRDQAVFAATFTPDGTKYIDFGIDSDIQIMDFDRCTGELSNPIHIPLMDNSDIGWGGGAAVSPNSRFLYISAIDSIYQFDLWAPDIASSKQVVAVLEHFIYVSHRVLFTQAKLAPNGKIIIASGNDPFYHIIEHPDSLGIACTVRQRAIEMPYRTAFDLPNTPHFRLGALTDSPCDTLGTSSTSHKPPKSPEGGLSLRPNPANDYFVAELNLPDYSPAMRLSLEVLDARGQVVKREAVPPFAALRRVDVAGLAVGLYFVRLVDGQGRVLAVAKVVKGFRD